MSEEVIAMAGNQPIPFPQGACSGKCEWREIGGEWFTVNSTCADGCTCAGEFKLPPDGKIKKVVFGSTNPGDGLSDPDFQKFVELFGLDPDGIDVPCVPAGTVIDLTVDLNTGSTKP